MKFGHIFALAVLIALTLATASGCSRKEYPNIDTEPGSGGRVSGEGGAGAVEGIGGIEEVGGSPATGGAATVLVEPTGPLYHPPPGFEDCIHAVVKADCQDGWCRVPPSCVVIGSSEDAWVHGRYTEIQTAITLTHAIEVQQKEFSKAEWASLIGKDVVGEVSFEDGECAESDCPRHNVTWWEAVHAADALSKREGLQPCYESVNCAGELGEGRTCERVADPEKSVYECEGYRLPTWAEAEYSARAGTISDFYSGTITVYASLGCQFDENLEKVAWYCQNSENRSHPGAQKLSNGFGLFDKLGNVAEWTNEQDRSVQAEGGGDPSGAVAGSRERLIHGGMYNTSTYGCTAANLLAAGWDTRGGPLGFRLYRTLFEDSERSGPIIEE